MRRAFPTFVLAAAILAALAAPAASGAEATWQLEQPPPPPPLEPGVQGSGIPVGLGGVGDIEFLAPNRGLLITAGNPPGVANATIPAGVWTYNGAEWHELSNKCGATDGRIAWAGPDEFWTVSDGRPGQSANKLGQLPPLEDNTLCHFAGGQIVGSYASPAFEASSYLPMHGAGCIDPSDCWFAGEALAEPLPVGAFQLHWNGSSLTAEPYLQAGHAVQDMRLFEGRLYESVRLSSADRQLDPNPEAQTPFQLHVINPEGFTPAFEAEGGLPLYAEGEFPGALDFLHLAADSDAAGEQTLWAAAGPQRNPPPESLPATVTVVRYSSSEGRWAPVIGPDAPAQEPPALAADAVQAIAGEPGSEDAWLALDTTTDAAHPSPTAETVVQRVAADGTLLKTDELGKKGAAAKIACPAAEECWLATTQGWLFHLSDRPPGSPTPEGVNDDPAFQSLITYRPPDQGLPQIVPDAPPVDDSGLGEEAPNYGGTFAEVVAPKAKQLIQVPLLSRLHSRLTHGTTLVVSFHLAVKARVRLVAERAKKTVASTSTRTLSAGTRSLTLKLNPREWPTKLALQTRALAPLPTVAESSGGAGSNTESTSLRVLPSFAGLEPRS